MPNTAPKYFFWRNKVIFPIALAIAGKPLCKIRNVQVTPYRPRHKTFLLIANHNETLDPGFEMVTLGRYVRYVSGDHVARRSMGMRLMTYFGTPIIKYRDHPRDELPRTILETLNAGISVGLHAEGGMSYNGETRFISMNTAKLVKDANCAVITYRSIGGYLRTPRWRRHSRKGPLTGGVVREYDPEEFRDMTVEEIYDLLRRDLYVNAFEEQRKEPRTYQGEALAECCEIILYKCPVCGEIGRLHSSGDKLRCDCGYELEMGEDGFFHRDGDAPVYDNIRDWEHWQRDTIGELVERFRDRPDEPIFRDEGQIIKRAQGSRNLGVCNNAVLELYIDRMELHWDGGSWSAKLEDINKVDYVKWQSLLVVTSDSYFDISSEQPRSPTKYIDAWRYLTGRPNL